MKGSLSFLFLTFICLHIQVHVSSSSQDKSFGLGQTLSKFEGPIIPGKSQSSSQGLPEFPSQSGSEKGGKGRIGNSSGSRISLSNLHKKVNGQGEVGVRVTDVDLNLKFKGDTRRGNVNADSGERSSAAQFSPKTDESSGVGGGPCKRRIVNVKSPTLGKSDMDKWTLTLVKMSQCVANCLTLMRPPGRLSPTRRINETGGPTPVGISSLTLTNYEDARDGDVSTKSTESRFQSKMLSSCQKSCNFVPQKSSQSVISIALASSSWKPEETNKGNNPSRQKEWEKVARNDKNSSAEEEDAKDKTTFHLLQWPKVSAAALSPIKPSRKPVVLYAIIAAEKGRKEGEGESSTTWTLIDQTLSEQTQISLPASACPGKETITLPELAIRVLAIGAKGVVKVFSGLALADSRCCGTLQKPTPILANPKVFEGKGGNLSAEEEEKATKGRNPPGKNKNDDKNWNFASNRINSGVSYKVERDPDTRGKEGERRKGKWGLKLVSMLYKNSLVVTQLRWNSPKEKKKENAESGAGERFLLTWEIFGGGLKGNLVTDLTSGTISLWPDTAYFIQVGLIDPDAKEEEKEEEHQNYMTNLVGMESIMVPFSASGKSPDLTFLPPRVTFSSDFLLVNTSQLSIPKSSPSSSLLGESPIPRGEKKGTFAEDGKSNNFSNLQTGGNEDVRKMPITVPLKANGNGHGQFAPLHLHKHNKKSEKKDQRSGMKDGESGESYRLHHKRFHYLYATPSSSSSSFLGKNYSYSYPMLQDYKRREREHPPEPEEDASSGKRTPIARTHSNNNYRPEAYQGLFALNLGLGGYNEEGLLGLSDSEQGSNGTHKLSGPDSGAGIVYSVFVLVVVACVIFLFLVAFIGFFVVTSSISQTAQYFLAKRLKVWVIGESQLLENENETEGDDLEGRFVDLDGDETEWGEEGEVQQEVDVDLTHRDHGRI